MKKSVFLVLAVALVFFWGGAAKAGVFGNENWELTPDQELIVRAALGEQAVLRIKMAGHVPVPQPLPLPALPPPVMTDRDVVQAPTPRPLPDFPVAKPQPFVKPLPAIPTPPTTTEKGVVQTPTPRPLPDFPVAKPQSAKPAVEMSRQEKQKQWPWQVKNETNINIVVNPPAFDSGEDKKIASWLRPGELLLMQRKNGIWTAEQRKTNEIPPDYTLREGKETGS